MPKNMQPIEETILAAMDCKDKGILPYLPYILQDFWTIGSEPEVMIDLIKKHTSGSPSLQVLDLGCGKGAVSVIIAHTLGCTCHGIDAIPEFISFAQQKAEEYNVRSLCRFEQGDIREKIKSLPKYNVIIMGAIGQVLGNYYETLISIKPLLNDGGIIIIDDGYVDDGSDFVHPQVLKRSEMLRQIDEAGMMLADEVLPGETTAEGYGTEYAWLSKRCDELSSKHPDKAGIFENYKKQQQMEYENLKSEIICSTMVVKRKNDN